MKSYNHLWEKYISDDNYYLSVAGASKRKSSRKHRKQAKWLRGHAESFKPSLMEYARDFHNSEHTPIEIYDGIQRKKRTIIVPTMREQVVHHMVVNTLKPIFLKGMYEHSYGSIPDRGAHKGKAAIEKWIKTEPRNVKYCLKMDIKKYFDSIPCDVLKAKLAKIIHDERFLQVLYEVVDVQEKGIPLGFYTSQWLANFYLTDLDHKIKETMYAPHYIRYMDDMVVFGANKRKLHETRERIEAELNAIGLTLKGNWQVFRFDYVKGGRHYGRDLDFMGFRFFRDRTILRKSLMHKATRKARRMSRKLVKTTHDCRQMLSYLGWIDATDTYGMYRKEIKPYANIQYCKRRVSNYDKKVKKQCGNIQKEQTDRTLSHS